MIVRLPPLCKGRWIAKQDGGIVRKGTAAWGIVGGRSTWGSPKRAKPSFGGSELAPPLRLCVPRPVGSEAAMRC